MTVRLLIEFIILPLMLFGGSVICWRNTKESSALVMAISTFLILIKWPLLWSYTFFIAQDEGEWMPGSGEPWFQFVAVVSQLTFFSTMVAALSFVVFAVRLKDYANTST